MGVQLKSTFRRPLSAILLILLLGAVSFGFVSRTVEYLVVSEAVEETSKYYRSIGYLTSEDQNVTEGARLLAESDLVSVNDARRFCIGSLEEIYNGDLSGNSSDKFGCNFAEVLFWGELQEVKHYLPEEDAKDQREYYSLKFLVKQRLYGYPDYIPEGSYVTITCYQEEEEPLFSETAAALKTNTVYGVRAYYPGGNSYNAGMILRQAMPGEAWFLTEGDTAAETLVEADAVQEMNRHRVELIGTKDMSAMPFTREVSQDAFLVDGRWLNAEDDKNANPVCVILQDFADKRNLKVGDTLTITMTDEDLSTYYFFGYYPKEVTLQDIRCKEILTTDFTIVGIYNKIDYIKSWIVPGYAGLDIYIPDSCIPNELHTTTAAPFEEREIYEGSYNFVLKSAAAEAEFLQRYQHKLEDLGCTVHMIENGWQAFYDTALPIRQSAAYSFLVFFIAQMVTIVFFAFLYFRQHRREYAVARALGIPARQEIFRHLIPAAILGVFGIGIGSGIGCKYAMGKVRETLNTLIGKEEAMIAELSKWIPVFIVLCLLIVLVLAVLGCFAALSHRPILEILQGTQKKVPIRKLSVNRENEEKKGGLDHTEKLVFYPEIFKEQSELNFSKNGHMGMRSFLTRHIFRSKSSTALVLVTASIFLLTLGWIGESIRQTSQNIEELYENISVDAQILKRDSKSVVVTPGYISGITVEAILDTGYIENARLAAAAVDAHLWNMEENDRFSSFTLCGITGMDVLTTEETPGALQGVENYEVIYADGWDAELFEREYSMDETIYPIVIPDSIRNRFQVNLGEKLLIEADSRQAEVVVAGVYAGKFNNLNSLLGDQVLMPHSLMERLYRGSLVYEVADFTINSSRNRELEDFRKTAKEIMEKDYQSQCPLALKIWDEELREVVEPMEKNLRLMQVLFPIAQLVAMLAGGMVSLLLLLQNAKTAAILRVLGIPAKTVRRMLGAEKLLLGVAGNAAGMLLCAILGKWNMALLVSAALYLLGLLIGTVIGCVAVTRKKPLELLQVKE